MDKEKYAVLLLNDIAVFPNCEVRLESDLYQDKQVISLTEASDEKKLLIVNPITPIGENIDITQLPNIGVIASLKMKMDIPNGKTRIVLDGIKRVKIVKYVEEESFYEAIIDQIEIEASPEEEAYKDILIKAVHKYIDTVPYVSNSILANIEEVETLDSLTDFVISFLPLSYVKKKKYIEQINPINRTEMLITDMNEDLKIIELEEKLEREVEKELAESQKEYLLREKIKVIHKELGDINTKDDEIDRLNRKLSVLKCPPKVKDKIKREIKRYQTTSSNSPELGMIRDYLDWMINLPWNNFTKDVKDIKEVEQSLNATHYALSDVKERILEYLAVKQNTNQLSSPIICLVGPPGVGKTSLAISIATALKRKHVKISVGGINDEAEIVGHRRTYIGANPGRIIQGIRKAGTTNPVFIIDEIDKMRKDIKGDPASSLLEVLDPNQNSKFSDHYIEEEFDLSKVLFIATANYVDQIPFELRDRLEIIEVSSYTEYEKLDIAKNHLIPKLFEEHGLTELSVQFSDEAILMLIRHYTKEAGVRELERVIASLLRKIVKALLIDQTIVSYQIDEPLITNFLGKKKYRFQENERAKEIGVVNGLAYTVFGGDILPIEATYYKGQGNLIMTGSLGEVMKESAKIAMSYIKANIDTFGFDYKLILENDLHIHLPEGSVSKEGPSAGIALTTTLLSLLKKVAINKKIAMTGEITLTGKVLAIGGLKEKVIGAQRAGIKEIYLPYENRYDLDDIPNEIKENITFHFINNYNEIYKDLFKDKIKQK